VASALGAKVARRTSLFIWCALVVLLGASPALAQSWERSSAEGWGRISVVGGYRWVPNWYLFERAAALEARVLKASQGGPQAQVGFGYGVTDYLELAVDLFAAPDWFELSGMGPFTAISYGALIGPRLTSSNVLFRGLSPYLGAEAGPTFILLQSSTHGAPEKLAMGLAVVGGLHWRFQDRWAVTLDVRWLLARANVPEVSGFNGGGVLFSIGVSHFLPPTPQRDLEVPGFGAPSHL